MKSTTAVLRECEDRHSSSREKIGIFTISDKCSELISTHNPNKTQTHPAFCTRTHTALHTHVLVPGMCLPRRERLYAVRVPTAAPRTLSKCSVGLRATDVLPGTTQVREHWPDTGVGAGDPLETEIWPNRSPRDI